MFHHALKHVSRTLVGLALVAGTLVTTTEGAAAATVPCQKTFTQPVGVPIVPTLFSIPPAPPIALPPATGSSTLPVDAGTISDVNVTVHITYPNADLLTLSLTHGITTVVLKNLTSIAGADLLGTTFDDEATQTLTSALPPFTGLFQPASPLSAFDATDASGIWTLTATNPVGTASGSIDSWSVAITYAGTCDLDGDGVEDHKDSCLSGTGATASGCPLASRGVTAKYRHGRFKGVLSSSVPACRASQSVTVWKARKGADRKIGSKLTRSDGRYKLKRAKHRGKYYATSPRVVVAGVAECPAVRSKAFKVS